MVPYCTPLSGTVRFGTNSWRMKLNEFQLFTLIGGAKVAAVLFVSAFIVVLGYHLHLSIQRKGEAPVRWSWTPLLGFALEMGKRPVDLLQECTRMYGEIFGMVVAGNRMFIISDCHSYHVLLRPVRALSVEEFHHSIMMNFFGVQTSTISNHLLNDDLMRKWYSQYLLR